MRAMLAAALLVAAPALASPITVEREETQQQLAALASSLSNMQSQLDADPALQSAPGSGNLLNLLNLARRQVSDLQKQLGRARQVQLQIVVPPPAPPPPPPPPPQYGPQPMPNEALRGLVAGVRAESFLEGKLRVIQEAASTNFFLVAQLRQLVDQIPFSSGKVRAVEICAPRLLDRENAFNLYGAFTFSADKEKVRAIFETPPQQ